MILPLQFETMNAINWDELYLICPIKFDHCVSLLILKVTLRKLEKATF